MKKRLTQKLELTKETLRNLSERDLEEGVVGATGTTCWTITEQDTCTASGCPSNWSDCC
jgi:hypothetical protein